MFKRHWTGFVAGAALMVCVGAACAVEEGWTVDFAAGQKAAAAQSKDLFMEFTGSDWCPPCKALKAKIFDQPDFAGEAPKHFVLLKLDYPNDKSKQTEQEIAQNEKLGEQYGITGYPTVILADAKGRPYARTVGFGGGTPAEYVENLKKLQQVRVKRDELMTKAGAAEGVEKAKLLDEAISAIDAELAAATYAPEIEQVMALDAENKAGLKEKYRNILLVPKINQRVEKLADESGGDMTKAIQGIDALIEELKPAGPALLTALQYKASIVYQQTGETKEALKYLQQAIDADPKSEKAAELREAIKELSQEK